MPIAITAAAIVALVLLVAWAKVHPFLAFVLVAAAAALGLGMPAGEVPRDRAVNGTFATV